MWAFVKSFATYRTIRMAAVISSALTLDSLSAENSTVTVVGTSAIAAAEARAYEAPAALDGLPAPTHAFIGGSTGSFAQIADAVLAANPEARMVASAVTIETLYQALQAFQAHNMADVEVVQLSVAKARELGGLHLMSAQNPVWIISGQGVRDEGASC